ncbi:MAG: hypothetical protein HC841_00035 [Verrucomicrobiae bacterium]|nr:hypothetical protein [Verrucomicrobiae bacterium]
MSQKPETAFRAKAYRWIDLNLPGCWYESIQQVAIRGTPDTFMCLRGRFVALEWKADESSPATEMQKLKLERINAAGGIGLIVHPQNWEQVQKILLGLRGH